MASPPGALEQLLRHDRRVVVGALVLVAALAWAYTLLGVGRGMNAFEMTSMPSAWQAANDSSAGMELTLSTPQWGSGYAGLMLAMWWIMMVAMMLPSAAPTILLATALNRRSNADRPPYGTAGAFAAGYLLAWLLFSLVAVAAQWILEASGLLTAMMQSTSPRLSGVLLLAAGLWQLTPLKHACLRHCRSPVEYLTRHRRPGRRGALVMGLGHGSYCLGCCWFLMALLFAGGVMNLYWVAGLDLFVLAEKVLPHGLWLARAAGIGLSAAGLALLVR